MGKISFGTTLIYDSAATADNLLPIATTAIVQTEYGEDLPADITLTVPVPSTTVTTSVVHQ